MDICGSDVNLCQRQSLYQLVSVNEFWKLITAKALINKGCEFVHIVKHFVTCVVAWVGLRSRHQDISQPLALGPFGSSAFFFFLLPLMACRLRLWSYVDDFALVPETRVMKRGLTTPRTAYWNCSRSRDAAQHYNNTCARRKLAWSLCRATSRWTSFSCPWRIDPKVKKRTEDSKFLPTVDGGFGYNANFLTFDDRDTPLGRLGGGVLRRQGFVV